MENQNSIIDESIIFIRNKYAKCPVCKQIKSLTEFEWLKTQQKHHLEKCSKCLSKEIKSNKTKLY